MHTRAMSAAARAAGVNSTCWTILAELSLDGWLTTGRLAERLGMSTGGDTPAVDRLEALGCIERSRNPADGRSTIVAITASGHGMLRRYTAALSAALEPVVAALGEDERETVLRFLAALGDAYGATHDALEGEVAT
jgi:DNA-binding MarR family transcriptional regulator